MKRLHVLLLALMSLVIAGVVLGQGTRGTSFALVQQIGQVRPQGIRYDPNFDRFVMVDPQGRLLLVDGATFETQHVLYEGGSYNAYRFSHDGRWLALAIDLRVEIWDTQTGTENISIAPDGALSVTGPLLFSDDDDILLFTAVVRAPQELRRSENDTSLLPWLWDLPAARDEGDSTLPNRVEAYAFFDFRNGFVLGPNDTAIAALPERLQIFDIANPELPIINEILTPRNEQDPLDVWFSLRDDMMYVRPVDGSVLFQINTETGAVFDIPMSRTLNYRNLGDLTDLLISDQARIIGQPNTLEPNSLLMLLLGTGYHSYWNYHPLTIMLLDVLEPVTVSSDQMGLLVYIFDEQDGYGSIEFLRPSDITQMVLHPDNTHIAVRRAFDAQPVEVYNLDTGILEQSYFPTLPDFEGRQILAYNGTGDVITADFQRFDAATGDILYQDLSYHSAFEQYFFTSDSQKIVTLTGSEWWLWDIATGQVIRREQVALRGSVIASSPDAERFLSVIDTEQGRGVEVVEIGQDERNSLFFEALPGRDIVDIIPSPDWENFLVVYSANAFGQHYPGNEIALYNLHDGKRWFIAGDDLPHPDNRTYGWLDNSTAYITGENFGGADAPTRIYGLEYDPSGLPACLVQAFPDEWTQWIDLWEQLNARMRSDSLGRFTQQLCEALPATVDDVNAIFHPSPTPTLPPITATPSVIVGVPVCLTSAFPAEALDYAEQWRRLTEGLTIEQITELEERLCEGLSSPGDLAFESYGYSDFNSATEVMTIDMNSGARSVGSFLPSSVRPTPNVQLALDEFRVTEGYTPEGALLSPNLQLMAVRTPSGNLQIYRLLTPYYTLAANATATVSVQETGPARISVLPTATRGFEFEGQARPTLTPTVTLTPPTAMQVVEQSQLGDVQEICPTQVLNTLDNLPPSYTAAGHLLISMRDSGVMWVLDPATGELHPDETLPACGLGGNCNFSFDQNWILTFGNDIVVSRPDGSEAHVLFEAREQAVWPPDIHWLGTTNTIEYFYQGYVPETFSDAVTLVQRINMDTGEAPEPFLPPPSVSGVRINELDTELLAVQPNDGSLAVMRTPFNTGEGVGYKYYIYDHETGVVDYFARLTDFSLGDISFEWHPTGRALYYHYPGGGDWFSYDADTREHSVLGDLPRGQWSRDARYRIDLFSLPQEEFEAREEARQPIPNLTIWDSETGLTRHYCIPVESWMLNTRWQWSPDNRYIAMPIGPLNVDEVAIDHYALIVLDTETGYATELPVDTSSILVWTSGEAGQ
jgi:hypothetical protein